MNSIDNNNNNDNDNGLSNVTAAWKNTPGSPGRTCRRLLFERRFLNPLDVIISCLQDNNNYYDLSVITANSYYELEYLITTQRPCSDNELLPKCDDDSNSMRSICLYIYIYIYIYIYHIRRVLNIAEPYHRADCHPHPEPYLPYSTPL